MKMLVVIPARGGSKSIPKKNIRLMVGQPLIAYSIKNALELKKYYDTTVVVDTDDEEIADVAMQYGARVVMRPKEISGDSITLDPVIYHALNRVQNLDKKFEIVVTMQATSPTLKFETIHRAMEYFIKSNVDTLISGVNRPHLSWAESDIGVIPNYEKRLNRQLLPKHLCETGGFLISKSEYIKETSRIGKHVEIYEIPEREAIDIDTQEDWKVCETILLSKKILLRADGEEMLGMGHIYRTLSIAYHLIGHDILFVTRRDMEMGRKKLEESFFPLTVIDNDSEMKDLVNNYKPDIIVNDILNTTVEYMKNIKTSHVRIINFEDKGKGARYADAVINALYSIQSMPNEYVGFKYFFIRDEFLTTKPKKFSEKVENVVVLFGGTDPNDLTRRTYKILQGVSEKNPHICFHIITGFGYRYKNIIEDDKKHNIYVHNDIKRVSKMLSKADLAITAQGRTIYELACMGVPSIVLAQNSRELEHQFAGMANGFINLGLGQESSDHSIETTIEWLIDAVEVRRQMHELLLTKDFSLGQYRVINLVLGDEVCNEKRYI